jgi:hypothetical protein
MASVINVLGAVPLYIFHSIRLLFSTTHCSTEKHTVLLHSSPVAKYSSPLYVIISVLSHDVDSNQRADASKMKITLVRRGWRAGVLGWSIARYLGVSLKNGIDVTPEHQERWGEQGGGEEIEMQDEKTSGDQDAEEEEVRTALLPKPALSSKRQTSIEKQLKSTTIRHSLPPSQTLVTSLVRIPASSGDGYFRLAIDISGQPTAFSPNFRIFSLSLSSACPRGASLLPPTILPELVLRILSTALYSALLALFPVAAIIEKVLPRSWARWMMTRLYRALGMEERTQKMLKNYNVQERLDAAKTQVDQKIPWAGAGIRTQFEIQRDEQRGAGGVMYLWT